MVAVFIIAIIALLDLLHPGIFMGHDAPDHVARIANFYQSLSEGNIIPRWAASLNWGYGHPILMFLYPLPSYIASVFRFLGFSFVDSTKLVFAVSFLASIGTMYLWMKEQFSKEAGIVGALLYGFAPYRFIDLYVRGAIGEHVAFMFPPLLGYALLRFARKQTVGSFFLIALSTGGLILAHNALSLMFLPVLAMYGLYLAAFESKKPVFYILLSTFSVLLGFGLSAFFWVPAFFEGKYTLRDIVTAGEFAERMVDWRRFFSVDWQYGGAEMSRSLGVLPWAGVIAAIVLVFRKQKARIRWFLGGSLIVLLVSLLLMTDMAVPVWKIVTLLQKFQFPWRFLSVTTLLTAMIGAAVVSTVSKKTVKYVLIGTLVLTFGTTFYMWKAKGYMEKPEGYYSGIYYSTTDTGESSPIWSIRFMEHTPSAPLEIASGAVLIEPKERTTTRHIYKIDAKETARLSESTLFFPGWTIKVDGIQAGIQFQDPEYRGLMTFYVEPGIHTVEVVFGDTKLRKVANWASVESLVLLLIISVIPGLTRNPVFKRWIPAFAGMTKKRL